METLPSDWVHLAKISYSGYDLIFFFYKDVLKELVTSKENDSGEEIIIVGTNLRMMYDPLCKIMIHEVLDKYE